MQPADGTEYNLMHLVAETRDTLLHHQAIASDPRMTSALNARNARNGNVLSPWDGRLGPDIPRVAAIGTRDYPISPSALETWATCPYKFFLNRILGIAAPPEEEEDEMSASERGSLVHKILERFVREGNQTDTDLLELAEAEFAIAEERGVTGYPLLWDMAKEDIRAGLQSFMAAETEWLADAAAEASAEDSFGRGTEIGEVSVAIDDLGEIWFRGKIDRIDVVGDEVRVRDFKTGKPEPYFDGARGRKADRTLANGRAMQLPVYVAAARKKYPDPAVQISGLLLFSVGGQQYPRRCTLFGRMTGRNSTSRCSRLWMLPAAAYSPQRRRRPGIATRSAGTAHTATSIACVPPGVGKSGSARREKMPQPSCHSTLWAAEPP